MIGAALPARAETDLEIGIGTQDTTTNTVTGGIILKKLGFLEKHLPHDGKYKDFRYKISWQNFSSGPPITNGMMAGDIQIGMMGDYPLLVNGATGQATGNPTSLVAILAYNAYGGGNGIVVPKASPAFDLADLAGKRASCPFGSAAHGMMLHALQMRGLPPSFWMLVNQSPEIGSTNIQEDRIDANGGFVPYAQLLPFRGFAREIFDGAETNIPTFHGVVVRKDFAEKYPEIVVAYIAAVMEANDWLRHHPQDAAEKIEAWTSINREVAYLFLGPSGLMTLDPTLKPDWLAAMKIDYATLHKLNMIKPLDLDAWVDDRFVRKAFEEQGLDYARQLASKDNYPIEGHDPICDVDVKNAKDAGQIWVDGMGIVPTSSTVCTLAGVRRYQAEGRKLRATYVVGHKLAAEVFADQAFYVISGSTPRTSTIVPFLLRKDADAYAKQQGGTVAAFPEAVKASSSIRP